MNRFRNIACLAILSCCVSAGASFDLRFDQLTPALKLLTTDDRQIVEQTVELIKGGNHSLALVRLTSLNSKNPENSSLRILASYAQLQLGNLLGAFEEARKAESAPNGTSYKCYFLGKLFLLNGNQEGCRKELSHVKQAGAKGIEPDVKELEKDLKASNKKKKA